MVLVLVAAVLLGLLPPVLAKNSPGDWSCAPLTTITSSGEGCVSSSSYTNGVWSIATSNNGESNADKFCVISLSGEGVHNSKDFYVKARFSNSGAGPGPFGGITFNMEDDNNGNYVMMRLKVPVDANVQTGKIVNSNRQVLGQSKVKNDAVAAGAATLEILVRDEEETVWIDNVLEETISSTQPFFVAPGHVGFGFQSVASWPSIKVEGAEICTPISCTAEDGTVYSGGEQWAGEDGKTCSCSEAGITCVCSDETLVCPGGTEKWTDPEECESKCIKTPAYCVSSGDPHYTSFDGKYYDFHGECTYQAASCGDFVVNFKNVDFHNRAPRYTGRIELIFKGCKFSIERGLVSKVDDVNVQIPYIKHYNNGDRVEIINNGQLEIRLYNKGRNPSVRLRANNAGSYINAEMWLHGSCADITEGMCGNWNANPNDDLTGGSGNSLGIMHQEYDENCPAPPLPPDVCRDVGNLHDEAEDICSALLNDPFKQCNGALPVGDRNGGPMKDCMIDVCNCYLDQSCACAQFDVYATQCQNNGFDAANWRENVAFCPYDCPEPTVYRSDGATPVPTCLNRDPEKTGTVRGCFCPDGQFLQDGVCVDASGCKCLYEGQFYANGATIEKEAECQTCTCQDAGEMTCQDKECPTLNCEEDQLEARKDDECCPYCLDNWVVAENPDNQIKKGQSVVLTCEVLVEGVRRKDIVWLKDGKKITEGISKNKRMLTVSDADADDDGTYTCQATKDGVTATDDFEVDVVMPAVCEHEDGKSFEEGTIHNPQETEECTCDAQGVHHCACIDDGEECEDPTPVIWFNDNCVKTCVPEPGHCAAAADPFYSTFDGSKFAFKGDCKYTFFRCGDVAMYADHEKNEASTTTKYIEVAFKTDVFKLEGNTVTLNGDAVAVPMHKSYKDGSQIVLEDKGTYTMTITQDGKDPLVYLQWDKVSSYSIDIHGSCKGFSTGMCGKWDDDKTNDLTGPEGDVLDNAEDFGTAWAEDDETDCPKPVPPPDMCDLMGLTAEKPGYEQHVADILKKSPFLKCADVVDQAPFAAQAVQETCMCFDVSCACTILDQLAGECKAKGINTDGWQLNFPDSKCAPTCPEGSVFKQRGPKPAPSCKKPAGGKRSQAGCFCSEGKMMEEGKCVDLDNCKCEYAGQLYDVGDKYEKGAECLECECVGRGQEECEDKKCIVTCGDDKIEVEKEGECCPTCLANWVEAVNPKPDAVVKESLALTCKVNGVEVTKDNVKWFKFDPGMEDLSKAKRAYSISDDGLTLTINKMDAKKEGNFKCVVEKEGKTSEGLFEVALPLEEKDLVEAEKEVVDFVEGAAVKLQCNKLDVVTELWWTCNGKRLESGKGNVRIMNKKAFSQLEFSPAKLSDKGTCTCHAKGQGTEDSADIEVGGVDNEVTITPQVVDLTCKQGARKACVLKWDIDSAIGKVGPRAVRICRQNKPKSCKFSKVKGGLYTRSFGKRRKAKISGPYVAVVMVNGKEYISEPINLTVTKKDKKRKGREPIER